MHLQRQHRYKQANNIIFPLWQK